MILIQCEHTIIVQHRSFVFVKRTAKQFLDKVEWVYSCSCNNVNSSLLDSVGYHIAMEYLALQELLSDCIHILAVKKVVSEIDAIHDIHPQLDVSGNILF